MIIPAEEQERARRALSMYWALGRSPGRLCSRRADQRRRPSNRSRPAGDEISGTHLPKQNLVKEGRASGQPQG